MHDSLLTVTVVSTSPDTVLELVGELDLSTIPTLGAVIETVETGATSVVLDLAGLTFLDSSGMSLIATTHGRLHDVGGAVVLRSPQPNVLRSLQLVGLDVFIAPEAEGNPSRAGLAVD